MPTFKSKPRLIEAEQFHSSKVPLPFQSRGPYVMFDEGRFYVTTNHGNSVTLRDGDWVVLEPTGPHTPSFAAYPVREDIFAMSYELADGNQRAEEHAKATAASEILLSESGGSPMSDLKR